MAWGVYGVYAFLFLALYFEVFLMISFFEKRPKGKTVVLPKNYPSVAMIVPVWNEEKTLADTIRSLLALEYPKDKLEIIIVDDGSTDRTLEIARAFEASQGYSEPKAASVAHYGEPKQVKVFSKENGGKFTALNLGVANTDAQLIGCLDADSIVVPDALMEAVKKFEERPDAMAVVPAMKVWHPRRLLELMQAVEYTFGIFYKKMFDNLAAISVLPGPFSIYKRDVFSIAGPFVHGHQTEDMEMAFRMHQFHLPIVNAHTSVVYTKVPRTLKTLLKQRTRWSRGFLENSKDYKHMYFNPLFGYFGLLVLPFSLTMFFGAIYMVAYIALRLIVAGVGHLETRLATKLPLFYNWQHWNWQFNWFYFNTSMLTFLILITLGLTLTAILIGRKLAGANFGLGSLIAYFGLFGFIAPLWLARAAWGTITAKKTTWR